MHIWKLPQIKKTKEMILTISHMHRSTTVTFGTRGPNEKAEIKLEKLNFNLKPLGLVIINYTW